MAIRWTFKRYLAVTHQIFSATELQKKILKETGVEISIGQLCNFVNGTPKMIRFETAEILCSTFNCELGKFLKVTAKKMNPDQKRKLSYKNTPRSKIGILSFPVPENYKTK